MSKFQVAPDNEKTVLAFGAHLIARNCLGNATSAPMARFRTGPIRLNHR